PFLVATIASAWQRLPADGSLLNHRQASGFVEPTALRDADATIWVICPTVRTQELFFESLSNWNSNASFLPEAELAAVENILPDPEIAAERLRSEEHTSELQSPDHLVC